MHPYRSLYDEGQVLKMKNTGIVRIWASFVMAFGIVITGIEIYSYLNGGNTKYTFLSVTGAWSGLTILIAGIFATKCTSKNFASASQARRTIICQVSFALLAGINSVGMFGFHLVSIFGYLDWNEEPLWSSTNLLQTLECTAMSIYVVSFMLISALVGCAVAFYRSINETSDSNGILHTEQDTTLTPIFVPALKRPATKTQVIADIEATVDGYYRRLEEEDD